MHIFVREEISHLNLNMNIKETFLKLTSRTYPHGTESKLNTMLYEFCPDLQKDEFENLYIKIGESDTIFTSHLDTATSALSDIVHVEEGNLIKTDGKSILGADDKAGVTIMLHMIENKIPGLYYFFLGEEVGCVGSKKVAEKHNSKKLENIKKVVSFDRRGTDSVITYQASSRCCSDEFGRALADELNKAEPSFKYKIDPTGIYTDSAKFTKIYPECTNISVGYYSEHTFSERQNIEHLALLANACLKVDWKSLIVKRDPSKYDHAYDDYYGYGWGGYYGRRYHNNSGGSSSSTSSAGSSSQWGTSESVRPPYLAGKNDVVDTEWLDDPKFNGVVQYQINRSNGKFIKVDMCAERIEFEKNLIQEMLSMLELNFDKITWNGKDCKVFYTDGVTKDCDRADLIEYLPELDIKKLATEFAKVNTKKYSQVDYNEYCGDC